MNFDFFLCKILTERNVSILTTIKWGKLPIYQKYGRARNIHKKERKSELWLSKTPNFDFSNLKISIFLILNIAFLISEMCYRLFIYILIRTKKKQAKLLHEKIEISTRKVKIFICLFAIWCKYMDFVFLLFFFFFNYFLFVYQTKGLNCGIPSSLWLFNP